MTKIKFNGKEEKLISGAAREVKEGRGRFDLIPTFMLRDLAKHYEAGGKAHGDRNWEKGFSLHANYDSMFSHLMCLYEGDESEDHISAIIWQATSFKHTVRGVREGKLPEQLWDLPAWEEKLKENWDST